MLRELWETFKRGLRDGQREREAYLQRARRQAVFDAVKFEEQLKRINFKNDQLSKESRKTMERLEARLKELGIKP